MKPRSMTIARILIIFCATGAMLTLVAWGQQQIPGKTPQQTLNDTTKKKNKQKQVRDLDEAIDELDHINLDEHMEKAMKEVNEAMKQIDGAKLQLEIDKAMKEVDFEKIKKEIEESMAKVDWDKMKLELDKAKQIDFTQIEKEMAKAREEIKNIQPQIERELKEAQKEIEKAKIELKEYKTFIDGLEKDGLINKKENYTIQHKNGKLLINDKEASPKVYEKYRNFLEKHPDININKDADDFDIDLDDNHSTT